MGDGHVEHDLTLLRQYPDRLTKWERSFKRGLEHDLKHGRRRIGDRRASKLREIAANVVEREREKTDQSGAVQAVRAAEPDRGHFAQNIDVATLQALRVCHEQPDALTDWEINLHTGIVNAIHRRRVAGNVNKQFLFQVADRLKAGWRQHAQPMDPAEL